MVAMALTNAMRRAVMRICGPKDEGPLAWAALAVLCGVWAMYFVYVVTPPQLGIASFVKTYVFSGLLIGAAYMCIARAIVRPEDRLAWGLLGTGMASWALASIYWSAVLKGMAEPPYPSVADALYLGFYPPAYIALLLLIRPHARGLTASLWLDGVIGVLAISATGAAFLVPAIVADTSGGTAVVATNLAYPICDVTLIALVFGGFAVSSWRPGRALAFIGCGLVIFAVADTIYLLQTANGTFEEGKWLDSLWPAGMVILALAAWRAPVRPVEQVDRTWPILAMPLPLLFALSSVGVLVLGNFGHTNAPATVLAGATVVVALMRLMLSFREIRLLSESHRQAKTDELTGLPNRRHFFERLEHELALASDEQPLAVVIADLDRFKELNDGLGHGAGDSLLQQLGLRVLDVLRDGDMVARLGGDEFAVLMPGCGAEGAQRVVEEMRRVTDEPFAIDGLLFKVDASVGVAIAPEHGNDADTLLARADVAMYRAKEAQTACEVYDPVHDVHGRDRLTLIADLRTAIEERQLMLHYQPKLDLRSDVVTGVEALVRWAHPEKGVLAPGQFLPLADRLPLMRPLTMFVLDEALAQAGRWRDQGLDLSVAVNLAVPNLLDMRLPGDVAELLERYDVPADRLCLEVTENVVLADPERILAVLHELKQVGVSLAMDDFGTGSSSLSYLKRLPIDELKIDKSFVFAMEHCHADEVIVHSTTELAQRLGMRVVAEGVETPAALDRLRRAGCEEAQGYLLHRPAPADDIERWIAARADALGRDERFVSGVPAA